VASENDQPSIEQLFSESWDEVEPFYGRFLAGPDWQYLTPILGLISDLRSRGYDQRFRAGQSMVRFVLSRSKEWGLRQEQAFLSFDLNLEGGLAVAYYEPPETFIELKFDHTELNPQVEQLLLRLLTRPID
jgi:hypothetical protein